MNVFSIFRSRLSIKMVVAQNKRVLLVLFFLLCFISIQARARALKEKSNIASSKDDRTAHHKEEQDHMFKPKKGEDNVDNEVFSMDYTPARRKPPIHN
ncbi:uncharacterized protein LOC130715171 [Lotus japonicus]|uniref:uncharacterized protein LOC130715171 n=1 Tax=Lotus japonicus TaxID=34305 RepID=UPI00258A23FB|nr:uncharacterized protein LOC130715171 [Lotus japonicus]